MLCYVIKWVTVVYEAVTVRHFGAKVEEMKNISFFVNSALLFFLPVISSVHVFEPEM